MNSRKQIKALGLKVTTPRVKILNILENSAQHHLSAEDIYHTLCDTDNEVGLATVYRVLTQFEEAGLIKRHNFEDDRAVFELDAGEHHDHLVCVKCSHVEEFVDETIEKHQDEIATKAGYSISHHALTMYGLCPKCRDKH